MDHGTQLYKLGGAWYAPVNPQRYMHRANCINRVKFIVLLLAGSMGSGMAYPAYQNATDFFTNVAGVLLRSQFVEKGAEVYTKA